MPPELAPKRPIEEVGESSQDSEAKRMKPENQADENSLEDGLALLVQNALSNVGDLADHFDGDDTTAQNTTELMDLDATSAAELLPPAPTFTSDPLKFLRSSNINALGNMVRML